MGFDSRDIGGLDVEGFLVLLLLDLDGGDVNVFHRQLSLVVLEDDHRFHGWVRRLYMLCGGRSCSCG